MNSQSFALSGMGMRDDMPQKFSHFLEVCCSLLGPDPFSDPVLFWPATSLQAPRCNELCTCVLKYINITAKISSLMELGQLRQGLQLSEAPPLPSFFNHQCTLHTRVRHAFSRR